jgi:hypothetical protein
MALCEIFAQGSILSMTARDVVLALNSWSSTDLESYDFKKRLDGTKIATAFLQSKNLTQLDYAVIAYNFFFTLKNVSNSRSQFP